MMKLLVIALLAGLLIGVFHRYGWLQYEVGEKAERAVWLARENQSLAEANGLIQQLQTQAREMERRHADDMAAAATQFQKDLTYERSEKARALAALRDGSLRLRVPLTFDAGPNAAGGGGAAAPGPRTAGGDGEARGELSVPAAEFLVGLATEADEVVHQLTACQAVVSADHKQQGEP